MLHGAERAAVRMAETVPAGLRNVEDALPESRASISPSNPLE